MSKEITQAIITLLAVVNPAVSGMIHLQLVKDESKKVKIREATKSSIEILVILIVVSLIGESILRAFGISMESFRLVGGIVIAYIGFTMLAGKMQKTEAETSLNDGGKIDNRPLVMFAASPGTIATVVTLSVMDSGSGISIQTLIAIGACMLITYIVLILMSLAPPKKSSGPSFVSQFMGLILIAMGVQFILESYKAFMFPG